MPKYRSRSFGVIAQQITHTTDLTGLPKASVGDWIVTYEAGQREVVNAEIFSARFVPVKTKTKIPAENHLF